MKFDIKTLVYLQSLTFITQVVVLSVQYRVNRTYRGIGWWVRGSSFIALGVILMPMLYVKPLEMLARFANPLLVLGQIFLYIGIVRFLDKKENRRILISIYAVYIIFYFYFIYVSNSISARTVVVNAALATITIMTAYKLFSKEDRIISGSANFTATVFLTYGFFLIIRTFFALILPPVTSYSNKDILFVFSFIVPIIASTLWTFGFIIMLNQRLNMKNLDEITERKQAEEALMESEEKYRSILDASPDDITITDLEGRILLVSPASKKMFGYEPDYEDFVGMRLVDFIIPEEAERAKSNILLMYKGGSPRPNEYHGVRKDQSIFHIEVNSGFVSNSNGKPNKMVFIIRDITERKLTEQKIQQLVHQLEIERNIAQINSITDSLTGLANRRYFDEALRTEFYRLKRSGSMMSLIMLDVDYFKNYNDSYGHLAGDDCLMQIGNMFKIIVGRVLDIAARYGGEEFAVILPETDNKGAKILAERILEAVEKLAISHPTSDVSEHVTVSIGVVTINASEYESPEQAMTLADEALYLAKKGGRNRIEVANANIA